MPLGRLGVKPYARVRTAEGLPGGSPAAVRKALQRHGVPQAEDGSFDADRLHALWEAERSGEAVPSPPTQGETGKPAEGNRGNRSSSPPPGAPAESEGDGISKAEALRQKEVYLAKKHRLDYLKRAGRAVDREAVKFAWATATKEAGDQLDNLADRISDECAAETDPRRVHALIRAETRRIREALARDVPGLASAVAAAMAGDEVAE